MAQEWAMCHSKICSRLVWQLRGVLNSFLRSTVERDPEGSEDQWSMSLGKFDIRYFDVYLPYSSPDLWFFEPHSIYRHVYLAFMAKIYFGLQSSEETRTSLFLHIDTIEYPNLRIVVDLWTCTPLFSMVQINFTTTTFESFDARPPLFSRSTERYPFLSPI